MNRKTDEAACAPRLLALGFTGYTANPEAEDTLVCRVSRHLAATPDLARRVEHHPLGWRHRGAAEAALTAYLRAHGAQARILLYGHSYGAGRALDLATALGAREPSAPVAVLALVDENRPPRIPFLPVWGVASRREIPANVAVAYNAYTTGRGISGAPMTPLSPATRFTQKSFPAATHGAIDTLPEVVADVLALLEAAAGTLQGP